ncbi:MAG: AarF/ABC1/UbiB kinase family protein [Deltaproteobacteria bacterium]|nr:AarF/ABC1/UbiB kinase family protein [Deltaproteobacteria bacterium]
MTRAQDIREKMLEALKEKQKNMIPTSRTGRFGSMAKSAIRGALIYRKGKKNMDGEDELPLDTEQLVKLITSVGQLKGIAMKMGQIMSYIDMAIPKEMQEALSVLQTHAQSMPFKKVTEIIQAEPGLNGNHLLLKMEEEPVSAASIGQVHRAILPDGTTAAVKIQYPEIAKSIISDFGPASAGTKMASIFFPNAHIDNFITEAKDRFLEECDYKHEAHCQEIFAAIYKDHPVIQIPSVHEKYCTQKILTTTFVDGISFENYLLTNPSQHERNIIGEALFEFYIGSLFRHQIYNCDPHPGNYLFHKNGKITMLDHGCTRQFEPSFVARLANLTSAIHSNNNDEIHNALIGLKIVKEGKKYDFEMIHGFLKSFYGAMLKDETCKVNLSEAIEMREVFKKKQQLMKFSLPGEFTFLFRIRFGLMSVLSRLQSEANWYQLEHKYVNDFAKKFPLLS